jgi:hypothetical protein
VGSTVANVVVTQAVVEKQPVAANEYIDTAGSKVNFFHLYTKIN